MTTVTFPVSFAHPIYLLLLPLSLAIVFLLWRRRSLARVARRREIASLILRAAILALLILSLAELQWVRTSDELAVVFLLDMSDSVNIQAREGALAFIRAALADARASDRAALVLFGLDALAEWPLLPASELLDALQGTTLGSAPGGADLFHSIPTTVRTDVGGALRLGLALLPTALPVGGTGRRLVLLSDGNVNVPGAEEAAALAKASGTLVDVVPLDSWDVSRERTPTEAWVDSLDVPSTLYEGDEFNVAVRVQSTVEQRALLRLFASGRSEAAGPSLRAEDIVSLGQGLNSFLFSLSADSPGFQVFTVQLVPENDFFPQNNALGTMAVVHGTPAVLIVAQPQDWEAAIDPRGTAVAGRGIGALALALERSGLRVDRTTPARMPSDLIALGRYETVVLFDVPASRTLSLEGLNVQQMASLQAYVRDLGRGLVCVGGDTSYGVGGYLGTPLEEALPVEMTLRDKGRIPELEIVFVLDSSGSMASMAGSRASISKIDLVKEAVIRSSGLLQRDDRVGVIAFDSTARWVWPRDPSGGLARLSGVVALQRQVATLHGGGGTDIYAGLSVAVAALEQSAQVHAGQGLRHVILLTDGGASQEGLGGLVARLRAIDGTLSVVGVGRDAAPFLAQLALDGGGRYHYTDDPETVPEIFVQETALARKAYIVEEPFYPLLAGYGAMLEGIEDVPPLYGYVATTLKPVAQMILASDLGDPVLAQWQYGLGRAVAWTSDAESRWAREWVQWQQFPRFWTQVVRWTILEHDESSLQTYILDEGKQVRVAVDTLEQKEGALSRATPAYGAWGHELDVQARFIPSLLESGGESAVPGERSDLETTIPLQQVAPGRYEGSATWSDVSARDQVYVDRGMWDSYLVRVDVVPKDGSADVSPLSQVMGYIRPYSAEYRSFETDRATLRRLAEIGGGRVLSPGNAEHLASVFARDRQAVRTYVDLWPWLLAAAVCLLPLDVGVRRVALDLSRARIRMWLVSSWQRVRYGVSPRHRRPGGGEVPEGVARSIARLMVAKRRRALREEAAAQDLDQMPHPFAVRQREPDGEERGGGGLSTSRDAVAGPEAVEPEASGPEEMAVRLLSAKQRSRPAKGSK